MKLTDEEMKVLAMTLNDDVVGYSKGRMKPEQYMLLEGIRDRAAAGGERLKNPATPADIWAAVQGTAGKST